MVLSQIWHTKNSKSVINDISNLSILDELHLNGFLHDIQDHDIGAIINNQKDLELLGVIN